VEKLWRGKSTHQKIQIVFLEFLILDISSNPGILLQYNFYTVTKIPVPGTVSSIAKNDENLTHTKQQE
jgi:hypothetical protein